MRSRAVWRKRPVTSAVARHRSHHEKAATILAGHASGLEAVFDMRCKGRGETGVPSQGFELHGRAPLLSSPSGRTHALHASVAGPRGGAPRAGSSKTAIPSDGGRER